MNLTGTWKECRPEGLPREAGADAPWTLSRGPRDEGEGDRKARDRG